MTPSGSAPNAASPRPLGRNTSSAPGARVVVDVVDVDVVVEVVEVVVDVEAAVVTGVVVDVVPDSDDVVAPLSLETDDEVDAGVGRRRIVVATTGNRQGKEDERK